MMFQGADQEVPLTPKKAAAKPAPADSSESLSAEERAAMKERAKELKAQTPVYWDVTVSVPSGCCTIS
jgi:hypothetical protein